MVVSAEFNCKFTVLASLEGSEIDKKPLEVQKFKLKEGKYSYLAVGMQLGLLPHSLQALQLTSSLARENRVPNETAENSKTCFNRYILNRVWLGQMTC